MIEIYTDGAYNPVLGQGGWGAVVIEGKQKQAYSGTAKGTTSNRMEINAALEGILRTPQGAEVVVYTDSQDLFGCMVKGWQRRANRDLWEQLDKATGEHKVRWQWIERATNPFHKEAHTLATSLASQRKCYDPYHQRNKKRSQKFPLCQNESIYSWSLAKRRDSQRGCSGGCPISWCYGCQANA